ncbi:Remorin family protein [Striga hermonthica]|uniref:Remorin family protein n=1 Tax=Striga hermonthica TaxID=68872 RepID=A0A9N7NXM7_STRHE|nr:Remorin family protein [Striga hermonthica]
MPELEGFQDSRSGSAARDLSPDSVIFTVESSNFSLFSSASASVERCSFASDQDFAASHLAGHELSEVMSSGPDPDPNKPMLVPKNSIGLSRKQKTKVQKVDSSEAETTEDENTAIGSARNSFSQALKECQDRKLRSEAHLKKPDRRRPTSMDLNNTVNNVVNNTSSPRLGLVKRQPTAPPCKMGIFPSPITPNYRQSNVGIQKGWSSERVPLHASANRRNLNTPLLSYNNNGRTLPSKWEDAERWIYSPVLGDGGLMRTGLGQQAQRKPKSKSGPLGPPGVAYYQMFSPAGPMLEVGANSNGKFTVSSPFSASVEGVSGSFSVGNEPCMARSVSIHGCSELVGQSSSALHHHEEKYGGAQEDNAANNISRVVSRRDMATQMSPDSSSLQSSQRLSSSFSEAILPVVESRNKPEIRDVLVDERVTMTRWSKKNGRIIKNSGSRSSDDCKRNAMNFRSRGWEAMGEESKSISKIQREEAKITAWENLQKAKAEAAIRKLEMKLEKKRSSSMDKIMNKLRSAQKKAQEMRSSVLTNQTAGPSDRALSLWRTRPIGSLSGCFSCHAF